MRMAIRRPDGSVELSEKIEQSYADLDRYTRFKMGESFLQIAEADGLDPEVIKISIRKGRSMYEAGQIIELRDLKHEAAIEAEKIRREVRMRVATKIVDAIDLLLEGKQTVVQVNKLTGEVTFKDYVDPEVLSMGIEHARKIIALEEKPIANQTLVNIQQNTQNVGGNSLGENRDFSYEERLARIRRAQSGSEIPMSRRIIEAEPVLVTDMSEPPAPASEVTIDEGWGF